MFDTQSIEDWKRIRLNEKVLTSDNQFDVNEENDEIRAWSQYQTNNGENILEQNPIRRKLRKQDENGVEKILSFIDKRRPQRQKNLEFSYRLFLGTMSEILEKLNQTHIDDDFTLYHLSIIYIDSVFRGISQVMFANNPLTGIIITIGLFIGNWQLAFYGLFGTCVSTMTAYLFQVNPSSIQSGLFGYNGCLIGMGIGYFSFSNSPQLLIPILFLCVFATIFSIGIGKILVERLRIPPFTFSFQVCVWIWLLASYKSRYFLIDGTILSPQLLTTYQTKLNVTYQTYTVREQFRGFFSGVAQVYFIDNPYTGAIILVGVALCSRISAFFAFFGSLTGQLTASYLLGVSPQSIIAGLWGYNSVLTCQALGGMFFVLNGYIIWIIIIYASLMTVIIQSALSSFLTACGMPTLTFPFTFICWIFCLIGGSKYMIAIELNAVSLPEDHRKRLKFSNLVQHQFQTFNYFQYLNFSKQENLVWEQLLQIEKVSLPILINSYICENNLKVLKKFYQHNPNIFNHSDENNRSPLHISVSYGNFKITRWLIEKVHLDINVIDKFGNTPLFDALTNQHYHLMNYLYQHGARFSSRKSKQLSFILNGFIFDENIFGIDLLLSCGLNPNGPDIEGRNALHIAVINNKYHLVRYLMENYPIWLELRDIFLQKPLNYASYFNHSNIEQYLFETIQSNSVPLIFNGKSILNELTYENLRDNNVVRSNCFYPFLFNLILIQKDAHLLKEFIDDHKDINIFELVDYDYRTIAHYAADQGHLETFEYLFSNISEEDFIRILFQEDRWKLSAIDHIYINNHTELIEFIEKYFSNQQICFTPTSNSSDKDLLEKWEKIYLFNHLAATGQSERIEHLFQRKYFDSNQFYHDYNYRTAAHYAAANGHMNVIQILIRYNFVGLFQPDRWGLTPYHHAKLNHFEDVSDLLIYKTF